jgi:transcriptional regulator with XRE-family HTH domain
MPDAKNRKLVALGKQIRSIREARGWSQEELARRAELDRAYCGSVERGERNISALNLIRISTALEVEVGELFPSIKGKQKRDAY